MKGMNYFTNIPLQINITREYVAILRIDIFLHINAFISHMCRDIYSPIYDLWFVC